MIQSGSPAKESVPWLSTILVAICLATGFATPFLVLNQTLTQQQGQWALGGSVALQLLVCLFGFFHAGKDFPRLFWVLGPVVLLGIVLVLCLLPDLAFGD